MNWMDGESGESGLTLGGVICSPDTHTPAGKWSSPWVHGKPASPLEGINCTGTMGLLSLFSCIEIISHSTSKPDFKGSLFLLQKYVFQQIVCFK